MTVPGRVPGRISTRDVILVAVLLACVSTLFNYRGFGRENQIPELPLILRAADARYLATDFYTNAASRFGPKTVYSQWMALWSSRANLHWVCLIATLLINVAIALITLAVVRRLFQDWRRTGLLAVALVMAVHTFNLGYYTQLFATQVLSATMAAPFAFLAFYFALTCRVVPLAISGGAATLMHPTFGAEASALALILVLISQNRSSGKGGRNWTRRRILDWSIALSVLGVCAAAQLLPFLRQPAVSPRTFVEIETFFRHPHHSIPSFFRFGDYVEFLFFTLGAGIAWREWRSGASRQGRLAGALLSVAALILFLCVFSFLFVEVFHDRWWATARPFRLLYLWKWFGLIFVAGSVAKRLTSPPDWRSFVIAPSLFIAAFHPVLLGVGFVLCRFEEHRDRLRTMRRGIPLLPVLAGIALPILVLTSNASYRLSLLFAAVVFLLLVAGTPVTVRWVRGGLILALILPLGLYLAESDMPPGRRTFGSQWLPEFRFTDIRTAEADVARFVRHHLPGDAVFLTPPMFGKFRMIAERGTVVDWKSFPFQDRGMVEWKKRIDDCYGPVHGRGHAARSDMSRNYRRLTANRLALLSIRYGCSHAVLFRETPTSHPVLYANLRYKLVALE